MGARKMVKEQKENNKKQFANKKETYKSHIDWRNRLTEADFQVTKQTDQAILTISAGALTLSVTFIKLVIDNPVAKGAIILAWSLFGASILFTLISLFTSRKSLKREIMKIDVQLKEKSGELKRQSQEFLKDRTWQNITSFCNIASGSTFITAWFSLIFFMVNNL